jgi:hypothetical protein
MKDDENDEEFVDRINQSTGFKKVNENRWHELRKPTVLQEQKVGRGISSISINNYLKSKQFLRVVW